MLDGEHGVREETLEAPEHFANHILVAALTGPGSDSPLAARTTAALIALLAAEGADQAVTWMLSPLPGQPASFDVVTASSAGHDPIVASGKPAESGLVLAGLDALTALQEAAKLVGAGPGRVTMVSVSEDGLRRTCMERDANDPLRFVFPHRSAFDGPGYAAAEATARWRDLSESAEATASVMDQPVAAGLAPGDDQPVAAGLAPADDPETGTDAATLAEAVRDALADVMVEVDMAAVEQMVSDALRAVLASAEPRGGLVDSGSSAGWTGHAALVAAADQFHVVLESFNDRIRSGTRSLQGLADELAARERMTAAYTEQLGRSINASIERLARHLDHRLDELGPIPAPDREKSHQSPGAPT
jgi:hypothetical protein